MCINGDMHMGLVFIIVGFFRFGKRAARIQRPKFQEREELE